MGKDHLESLLPLRNTYKTRLSEDHRVSSSSTFVGSTDDDDDDGRGKS